ncbi:MAG: lipopolysaccharide biosynthesis protein [Pseudomonadales bacterium]|uniref:PST family polysaccharide transporter n=1 Tax=Oleiphilus messinensis TaxID=141451 RepID=A0A1Y0I892_9GAMM|nr:lipopolysaccharide biosynthesis protein [Oleiphilus messinensis]ARU56409.1 PST family polysaccharide transporter [Oleiphilus messinensis]MCG8611360.1 lipopolysaccharide biosynthesis protein [Pseudomonadales bacterium]
MTSLYKKVFSGAALMVALRLLVKSIGLINTMILARLLVPEDFGLIALAMSVYAFIELINAFGFDVVLIQNQNATKDHYNTAWTLKLMFGVLAAIVMVAVAWPLADVYEDPRLVDICYCLAVMFLIDGLVNIGVVDFRKQLDFKTEFLFQVSIKVLTVSLTIYLAYTLKSYWALAFGMIANASFQTILSYIMSRFRPRFSLSKWREIYGFSFWLVLNNFLHYTNIRIKDLIIGKMVGVRYVGLYSVGDEIASLPSTELVAAINRATFPGYSKVSSNLKELRKLYLSVLSSIAMIGVPASIGLALVAPIFVPLILGEKWLAAVPIIQIIAFADALISINTNAGYVFLSVGKPRLATMLLAFRALFLIPLMIFLISVYGYIGAAYAVLITSIVMFPVYFIFLNKFIAIQFSAYLGSIIRPMISALGMYAVGSYVYYGQILIPGEAFTPADTGVIALGALILIGMGVFVVIQGLSWLIAGKPNGPEKLVLQKLGLQ